MGDQAGEELGDPPVDLPCDSMVSYNPSRSTEELDSHEVEPEGPVDAGTCAPDGRFRLRGVIGKGGFGEVWEAVQVDLQRMVAVKRLRKDVLYRADNPQTGAGMNGRQLREAFRQEVLTAAHLQHPNILPVHDIACDQYGELMMAMKRIHGTPWDELLYADAVHLSAEDFLARHLPIFMQMCQAVAYAHSRGVLHRDLKPTQVMVGDFGEVLLTDWGLAVVYEPGLMGAVEQGLDLEDLPTLGTATSPAGTPAFMAPEQTDHSARELGPWTDVYLLGGTLYYLLTLHPPHEGATGKESFQRARLGYVMEPEKRTSRHVPPELARITMAALDANRLNRTHTVAELLAAMQDSLSGAGRRRESSALVEAVHNESTQCADYDDFANGLARLTRAETLWPENHEIPPLRLRLQSLYSQAALASGDLALARVQAGNVDDPDLRAALLRGADDAIARRARRERDRRLATILAGCLFVVIAAVSAFYSVRLAEERTAIAEARDSAHRMVSFVIDSLASSGETPTPAVREAITRVVAYYDGLPTQELTVEMRLQRLRGVQALVRAQRALGEEQPAREAMARAGQDAADLFRAHPTSAQVLEELAAARLLLGLEGHSAGDPQALPRAIAGSLALGLRLIATRGNPVAGESPEGMLALAAELETGGESWRIGEVGGNARVERALDIVLAAVGDQGEWRGNVAHLLETEARALATTGRHREAIVAFERVLEVLQNGAGHAGVPAEKLRLRTAGATLDLAGLLSLTGAHAEAEGHFAHARELAATREFDAPEQQLALEYPTRYLGYVRHLLATNRPADAAREAERALLVLRQRRERNPGNADTGCDVVEAEQLLARTLAATGDAHRADDAQARALALARDLASLHPRNERVAAALAGCLEEPQQPRP